MSRQLQSIARHGLVLAALSVVSSCTVTPLSPADQAAPTPPTVATLPLLQDPALLRGRHVGSVTAYRILEFGFAQDQGEPEPQVVKQPISLRLSPGMPLSDLEPGSPEDGAVRLYLFTTSYIERAHQLFGERLNFAGQENYSDLALGLTPPSLGNLQYTSSPKEFVLASGETLTAALVYHETGHRLFWMLEDQLGIPMGGPNHYVHCGLIEYFATSFAEEPVVAFGLAPLARDVSRPVRYPEGFVTLADTERRFRAAYGAVFETQPWHQQYLDRLTSIPRYAELQDGHESGLLVAHPLWKLRTSLGAAYTDSLVARAILLLPKVMEARDPADLAFSLGDTEAAQWFDLLRALLAADAEQSTGAHRDAILEAMSAVGYPVNELELW